MARLALEAPRGLVGSDCLALARMAIDRAGCLARRSVLVRHAEQNHSGSFDRETEGEKSGRTVEGLTSAEILRFAIR